MLGGAILVLGWAGCVSGPSRTELVLAPLDTPGASAVAVTAIAPSSAPTGGHLVWLPLEDRRPHQESLGRIGREDFVAPAIAAWTEDALHQLVPHARQVASGPPAPGEIQARPILHRFYLQNVDITKSANAVIEIEYRRADGSGHSRLYRGRLTGMNWWGTDDEMHQALRRALENCLSQIAVDLAYFDAKDVLPE